VAKVASLIDEGMYNKQGIGGGNRKLQKWLSVRRCTQERRTRNSLSRK